MGVLSSDHTYSPCTPHSSRLSPYASRITDHSSRIPPPFPRPRCALSITRMAGKDAKRNESPRINNRRALHDYFISAKIECGMVLVGSEVKSLRAGKAQLQDAYARIENGELFLHGAHIDPYEKAALAYSHEPRRVRKLLVHKRELKKLAGEAGDKGTTLIPLAIYFKDGRAKVELAVARGRKHHDKRAAIAERDMARETDRALSPRNR